MVLGAVLRFGQRGAHVAMACAVKARSVSHGSPCFAECLAPFGCLNENGRARARFACKFAMKFTPLPLKGHFVMACVVKSRSVSRGCPFLAECLASFARLHENGRKRARFVRKFKRQFTPVHLKGHFAMACALKSRSVSHGYPIFAECLAPFGRVHEN